MTNRIEYAEDDKESVKKLLRLRAPSLMIGLILGIVLSLITSRFEEVLQRNVAVAFFIPFIVYLADAVGTQTQEIYIRDLRTGRPNFHTYLIKETIIGIILGFVFAILTGLIISIWFKSIELTMAVSISVFAATASAPLIGLLVSKGLLIEHTDPAVGSGPLATVIRDSVSVLIYGFISSAIII